MKNYFIESISSSLNNNSISNDLIYEKTPEEEAVSIVWSMFIIGAIIAVIIYFCTKKDLPEKTKFAKKIVKTNNENNYICSNCKKTISEGSNYCPYCGIKCERVVR